MGRFTLSSPLFSRDSSWRKLRLICLFACISVLLGCGGGGGNAGKCSGGREYCAEFGDGQPSSANTVNTTVATTSPSTGTSTGCAATSTLYKKEGVGDTVFELPACVTRIRIQATFNGNSSNFIVDIDGKSKVNKLIGTFWPSVNFDGTYLLTGGGTVEITSSSGVTWTFTEVR